MLTGYPALVAWGVYAGALTEAEAAACAGCPATIRTARTPRSPERCAPATTSTSCSGRWPPAEARARRALARLRDDEADALAHARLERGSTFAWTWRDDHTLARPLRPVVHAAVQLLTTGALDRIKGCGGCRFLFNDESKNRSRRWCSMDDCGTAEKIRRYVAVRRTRATR